MIRSLNAGVSGIHQFQGRLDVIGNNIANSSTVGFKASRADFGDAFSQSLNSSGGQVGSGVATSSIRNLFNQGAVTRSERDTDLAIQGEGYFMVKDPVSGELFATRAGNFSKNNDGYLVTDNGYRLQGYSDGGLSTVGDLRVDATGAPEEAADDATLNDFVVTASGVIEARLSDGTKFIRGQVLLQSFRDPQALQKDGNNLYSGISAAGPLGGSESPTMAPPGSAGLGSIQGNALESSNVDLTNEFANLITTQRGFQASARIVTTSDEILQEIVNLKR